jgi:hypothetical protein
MLAAIALQESTCRHWLVGGIGEQGLMQLLGPNCDGAPNGNCQDPDFNIRRGAEYLRKRIDEHNGSVLAGLGAYNGWRVGVTAGEVYQMKDEGRCFAQPNLDYMHQMVNGWMQGKEGWKMGKWCKYLTIRAFAADMQSTATTAKIPDSLEWTWTRLCRSPPLTSSFSHSRSPFSLLYAAGLY